MMVRNLSLFIFCAIMSASMFAQTTSPYRSFTPADQWEAGIGLGLPFLVGDLDAKPGFGGNLHVRKSIDHIFSIRGIVGYNQLSQKGGSGSSDNRESDTKLISGSLQLVAVLNNMRFDKPMRKLNLYTFAGVGFHTFDTEFSNILQKDGTTNSGDIGDEAGHVDGGIGLAYRINSRFNIALEHTATIGFGKSGDLLDAEENYLRPITTYRDIVNFPHLKLNFNLGGKSKDGVAKSEPRYWMNPLAQVSDAIAALEARPIYDPTDTDGDGIIDAIDDEDNSPAGARVDTKGVTMDSDGDKVPDYKDKEPHSPPGYAVDAMGVANVPKYTTEAEVNRIVDAKIAAIKLPEPKGGDWFLPMVNFNFDRYDIRYSEYEKLYQVATVLKQNPNLKVVAIGHTDKKASETYNNVLSYNRAKAAIDFLVSQYGISRDRLILNWGGEGTTLVPVNGKSLDNRRVEFRVAKGETEMGRPEGPEAGKGGKMIKDAGF